jgi:hypothetical protein
MQKRSSYSLDRLGTAITWAEIKLDREQLCPDRNYIIT